MEIYFIVAISFAIMFTIKYTYQINKVVLDTLYMFDIDYRETLWDPFTYSIIAFLAVVIFMPVILVTIISDDRWDTINNLSKGILDTHFSKYFKK